MDAVVQAINRRKITQRELARRIGCMPNTITNFIKRPESGSYRIVSLMMKELGLEIRPKPSELAKDINLKRAGLFIQLEEQPNDRYLQGMHDAYKEISKLLNRHSNA